MNQGNPSVKEDNEDMKVEDVFGPDNEKKSLLKDTDKQGDTPYKE